jgi:hypothetical protein
VGGTFLDIPGAAETSFDPSQMGLMFLFQYMIGNVDWATGNTQNLKVVRVGSDHYAVPYDFDWSGLVDAPYAGPSTLTAPLHDSVRERLFLGVCWDAIDYLPILEAFQAARVGILDAIRSLPALTEGNRRSATDYVEKFYGLIKDPERAVGDLRRMCRRR